MKRIQRSRRMYHQISPLDGPYYCWIEPVGSFEIDCGKKDRQLFQKAIKSLDKIARQTHDLRIFTDGERRYGNLLFEICHELVKSGKPGRPAKTFKKGVHVRLKNKGAQAHKKGRKRPKYQRPWREHPATARTI